MVLVPSENTGNFLACSSGWSICGVQFYEDLSEFFAGFVTVCLWFTVDFSGVVCQIPFKFVVIFGNINGTGMFLLDLFICYFRLNFITVCIRIQVLSK